MNAAKRILVTGANGFVGANLVPFLAQHGHTVFAAARRHAPAASHPNVTSVQMPDLADTNADWASLLNGIEMVIHCAGVAHADVAEEIHNRINYLATERLAKAVKKAGVSRFIFVSSILAQTGPYSKKVLREDDPPAPVNAYGRAKLAAENAIKAADLPFTILRPVVIDGKNVKGNFAALRYVASLPLPLPLGSCDAPRSILTMTNFNAAILAVIQNPNAAGETYILADPQPLTIGEIVTSIRQESGRRPNIFRLPLKLLASIFWLTGKTAMWERVSYPLVASTERLRNLLAETEAMRSTQNTSPRDG